MRTKALVGIVAGLSLLATACGDDDTEAIPEDTDQSTVSEAAITSPDTAATTSAASAT